MGTSIVTASTGGSKIVVFDLKLSDGYEMQNICTLNTYTNASAQSTITWNVGNLHIPEFSGVPLEIVVIAL